jgi:tRNA 5-methylaminomethyl-2-thiouridine biosynthesis bifunctional protein
MKVIVIGAGLAGAATARALALQGCDVTVLEACGPCALPSSATATATAVPYAKLSMLSAPSAGLPVALLAPHQAQHKTPYPIAQHPIDNPAQPTAAGDKAPLPPQPPSPLTQLSHLGVAATLQAARSLLIEAQDWQLCGALQRAGKLGPQAHWFGDAAWVKPAALVAAWLAHPRITLHTGTPVHSLRYAPGGNAASGRFDSQRIIVDDLSNFKKMGWYALTVDGNIAGPAHAVVLANAYEAKELLAQVEFPMQREGLANPNGATLGLANANALALAAALHQVAGQVIYGPWTADWQALWPTLLPELAQLSPQSNHHATPCAINGNGHFIPAVPWEGGRIWLSGSTYEHDTPHNPQVTAQGMASNLQRLQQLIPAAAHLLAAQHSTGQVQGWAGARCTTRDRLPVVGAVSADHAPGLYVCSAMGSRGLSFAALCGQHVAAQIMQTSSPLPDDLRSAIDAARFF